MTITVKDTNITNNIEEVVFHYNTLDMSLQFKNDSYVLDKVKSLFIESSGVIDRWFK